jgi:uncharacterized protein YqeY
MISEQIEKELIDALKAKETERVDTLRLLKAAFQNALIAAGKPLDEAAETAIVRTQIKQRDEAAVQYEKAGRDELSKAEKSQAKILGAYLPEQPSNEALMTHVEGAISATGATGPHDMGKVMGALKQKLDPTTDMGAVAKLVGEKLAPK